MLWLQWKLKAVTDFQSEKIANWLCCLSKYFYLQNVTEKLIGQQPIRRIELRLKAHWTATYQAY